MKRLIKFNYIIALVALSLSSCSNFDKVNTDPTAANINQVQIQFLINQSIIKDQQNPGVSERAYILYWVAAGRQFTDADGGTFSHGEYNDGWTGAYYRNIASALNSANKAIQVGEHKIETGNIKPYTQNLIQVARIWRAYLMSEMSDNFGPIPINGFQGSNPHFSSTKDVYYYMLKELKDASSKIDLGTALPDEAHKEADLAYDFDFHKWQRFANSLRLRLAMRLSVVDQDKAKAEFLDAAKGPLIEDMESILEIEQKPGWDDATGVFSRSWYTLPLTATLNNLTINLGGIKTKDQLNEYGIIPDAGALADAIDSIQPNDYLGIKDFNYFPTHTDNPTAGYWYNGLHETMDPRMYKIFYIPGNTASETFPSAGWVSDNTKGYLYDLANKDPETKVDSINARFTWNALQDGDLGNLPTYNDLINTSENGFVPSLVNKFRISKEARILFAPWETYFLIAEAEVHGWDVPNIKAKEAYEAGVKSSFKFWGISNYVNDYLNSTAYNMDGTSVKWDHTAEPPTTHTMNYVDRKTGHTGTAQIPYPTNELYKNGTVNNDHLTKIITQKFIAQAPWLSLETWSDHRRLGLPFFENVVTEPSGNGLTNLPGLASDDQTSSQKYLPQRMPYPSDLKNSNPDGYNEAVGFLEGEDAVLTPLWWAEGAQ